MIQIGSGIIVIILASITLLYLKYVCAYTTGFYPGSSYCFYYILLMYCDGAFNGAFISYGDHGDHGDHGVHCNG